MNNKSFLILWLIASLMVFGVMVENVRNVSAPKEVEVNADSSDVKNKLQKAGIIPREAKYWKEF